MIDLDIDLLTRQSNDNPVYSVQYAHTRLCADRTRARLWLTEASRLVLRNGLRLPGGSAPERM
ncbi:MULTISPECIES: hypothetical protein [Streptomyces]|uniref:Uncharacterized protein n=1 Tax=Streptomyces melanosporofaciens TaxID=67327 RepID=A0A1H5BUE9_STRMJ|nr:hypothetical protein [Streptomyces melanosporofaciens]SED57897.1 hypothetical protein SAMN04490356_9056 [Streptomyces melanosporofaciens]